ncbi:TPA: EpsG family protein [Enterobacter roggenkampii]|uniref:EpsG family protein n=1 Tax=Enterobacter TaxID=547 RepID=UPI0020046D89|nr:MULTISPECIES: EpsG family protein [Enterobacter]MCK6980948.1 EpsG family protein [Enterobacter roggenkampii]MDU7341387.1 EpsG family protein [Enterobacter sp.]UQQ40367.1 EpsG family protein [Enterobacter roggenkampii]HCA7459296.1 EpsG family protein [Enterobacter roggenkampii]
MFSLELVFIILSGATLFQVIAKENVFFSFLLIVFGLTLASIAGFRVSSPDYENYYQYFILLSNGIDYQKINIVAPDPAFAYFNVLLSKIYDNPVIVFVFFSFTSVLLNVYCFKKYVKYFLISILFYFVHTYVAREMMQIRAGLACAICLYSLSYLQNKKIWRFIMIIAVATAFHLGAIIFLLAYPLARLKLSSMKIMVFIALAIAISMFFPMGAFFKSLPNYSILERVQYYNDTSYSDSNGIFSNVVVIKELLIVLVCLKYRDTLKTVPYFNISFNLYVFSLLWLIVWNDFSIVASRIATFFSITEVLILAMLPFIAKEGASRSILTACLVIGAGLIMAMNIVSGKWDDIVLF